MDLANKNYAGLSVIKQYQCKKTNPGRFWGLSDGVKSGQPVIESIN